MQHSSLVDAILFISVLFAIYLLIGKLPLVLGKIVDLFGVKTNSSGAKDPTIKQEVDKHNREQEKVVTKGAGPSWERGRT